MKKSKAKSKKEEIAVRQKFLDVYTQFNNWLREIGFRQGHYWKESSTISDCHYVHYNEHIDSLHSVEHYVHDAVNLSIRFLRDRYEHKIMFVGGMGSYSDVLTLDQAKAQILMDVKRLRDEKLAELKPLLTL